jgi:hypothetical protein
VASIIAFSGQRQNVPIGKRFGTTPDVADETVTRRERAGHAEHVRVFSTGATSQP